MRCFLLLSLALIAAIQEASGRRYGKRPGRRPGRNPGWKPAGKPFGKPSEKPSPSPWENLWTGIPNYDGEIPAQELKVEYAAVGYTVRTNDTAPVGLLTSRPDISWAADPRSLYTIMIVDNGIGSLLPQQYIHWMVVNIPGENVAMGSEVMDYVTPFSIEIKDGKPDPYGTAHPMLVLVYKQKREILMEETRRGCSTELLTSIGNNDELAKKYNLQLVAGNFFNVPYSYQATEEMLCRFTKCTKEPFPFLIPGVNDGADCQPRTDVMDVTLRGPVKEKLATYNKYVSIYNPGSFISLIRNTYPVISTGVIREFRAVEGEFEGGKSLAKTLEGDMNVAMLVYQSSEGALQLFGTTSPEGAEILGKILPALAGGGDYKVLLVQPHDQDFDVNLMARNPENIIQIEMVKVKQGQENRFQELRNIYKTKARNSKYVLDVFTFDAVQGVLESLPADNLFNFDSTNNELMLTVYASQADMRKASIRQDPEFLSTFDCIACAMINTDLDKTYYPPFPENP